MTSGKQESKKDRYDTSQSRPLVIQTVNRSINEFLKEIHNNEGCTPHSKKTNTSSYELASCLAEKLLLPVIVGEKILYLDKAKKLAARAENIEQFREKAGI